MPVKAKNATAVAELMPPASSQKSRAARVAAQRQNIHEMLKQIRDRGEIIDTKIRELRARIG